MFAAAALAISILALIFSVYAVRYAQIFSASSVSVRQLSKLEGEMTLQADSLTSLHESLSKLRSRVGMRELRQRRKDGPEAVEDDLTTEAGRTAARTRLESQLASTGRLNARSHLRST